MHIDFLQVWRENWPLLALPVFAAVVGQAIGRLLRGRS
jgi:hypothetical protein